MGAEVIVLCGLPLHGKTTIGKLLSKRLDRRFLDVDDNVRYPIFGVAQQEQDTLTGINDLEMGMSYEILLFAADKCLELGKNVIIAAPFIRAKRQKLLAKFYKAHPTQVKIFFCNLSIDNDNEIERRLQKRVANGYIGALTTFSEYQKIKTASESLFLSHWIIDTSPPKNPEECVEEIINYL